jgi:hypothetical protein
MMMSIRLVQMMTLGLLFLVSMWSPYSFVGGFAVHRRMLTPVNRLKSYRTRFAPANCKLYPSTTNMRQQKISGIPRSTLFARSGTAGFGAPTPLPAIPDMASVTAAGGLGSIVSLLGVGLLGCMSYVVRRNRQTPISVNLADISKMFKELSKRSTNKAVNTDMIDIYGRVPYDDFLFTNWKLTDPDLLRRSFPEAVSFEAGTAVLVVITYCVFIDRRRISRDNSNARRPVHQE